MHKKTRNWRGVRLKVLYLNCHTGQTKYELITLATVLQKRCLTTTENYPTLCWLPTKCRSKQNMMCCRLKEFQMKTIGLLLGGSQCEGLRQKASCDAERALPKPTNPLQSTPIRSSPIQSRIQSSLKRTNDNVSLLHFMSPPLVTWLSKKQSGCWPRLHWARRTGREGGAQPIGSAGWRQVVVMQSCEERPLLPTIPTSGARLGISVVDILLLDRKRNCPANEKTGKRF